MAANTAPAKGGATMATMRSMGIGRSGRDCPVACRGNRAPRFGRCHTLTLAFAALLLGGCQGGASITVDATIPSPLVDPIQATMGVYFDDALVNYVHETELEDYGAYRLDIGASQAPVFARVFDAMFENLVSVEPADLEEGAQVPTQPAQPTPSETDEETTEAVAPAGPIRFVGADGSSPVVDGIIAPSIEEVQLEIPDRTGGDFYEVWISYKLTLFDAGGNNVGELPLKGYGKANERNFGQLGQRTPALHEATIWALRDAAAVLSFQFRERAEVRNWLAAIGVELTKGAPQ